MRLQFSLGYNHHRAFTSTIQWTKTQPCMYKTSLAMSQLFHLAYLMLESDQFSVHIRVVKQKPVLYRKKSYVLTTSLIIPTLELAVSSNLVEGGDLAKLGVITRGGGSLPFSGNLYISPNYLRFLCSPVVLRMKSIHLYPPPWQP